MLGWSGVLSTVRSKYLFWSSTPLKASYLRGGILEYLDVPLFTMSLSKMRNAVRWLKLLEETGIRKYITNRIKVGLRLVG